MWRFTRRPARCATELPPVSILKPLYGDEPGLEAALASNLLLDYPAVQLVFGVHSPADPAVAVVQRLRARFPHADITLVSDPARHGANQKIGNLINMLPHAKHDMLLISDADVHVAPDYLRHVVTTLQQPGVGLATSLYAGAATVPGMVAQLGATAITHQFLPGVLMSRLFGNQDCLGATMALKRETLQALGGLQRLAEHVADDHLLGAGVRELGLAVTLAPTIPLTSVPETALARLWRHELRWARTIRALVPVAFGASILQHELAWALLAVLFDPAAWTVALYMAVWLVAAASGMLIDHALRGIGATALPVWLLPLRDVLSFATTIASYTSNRVDWRGQTLQAAALPQKSGSLGTRLS